MLSFANKFTIIARVGWTNLDNVRLSLWLDSGRDPWYRVLAINFSGNDLGIVRRGNNCRCYFQEVIMASNYLHLFQRFVVRTSICGIERLRDAFLGRLI
jgi:hypothetical protein